MNKKIVWIVNEYNGPGIPRTRQILLSQHLRNNGYLPYIISSSTNNRYLKYRSITTQIKYDGEDFVVVRAPNYNNNAARAFSSLIFQNRLWASRKKLPHPDVIVSDFAGFFGNVFLKWKKKYNTKIIFDILDLWPEGFVEMGFIRKNSLLAKLLYSLEYKSYRNADGIIFSFQGGKNYIIDKKWDIESGGKVDVSDIGYLNNGIDIDYFEEKSKQMVIDDSDLELDCFKAVYLGSMSTFNGLDVIVEAARILKEKDKSNIKILMYGCGNKEQYLRELSQKYHLDNIVFKGKLDKDYAPYVLSKSNLNLFTFKKSNLLKYGVSPNKLFMYFASGKPILSMIKPAYDLVESRKCGLSVENDAEIIAEAIISFSKMKKDEYENYCANSLAVAKEFDYNVLAKELIRFIEK